MKIPPMPDWFPEALADARCADRLALDMDEAHWLRKRQREHPDNPYHWRVIWLYLKSSYNLWRGKVK